MIYNIADLIVDAEGCGERFGGQAVPYILYGDELVPDIRIAVTDDEVAAAMQQCSLNADDCRYILSGMKFYVELLYRGGLMLHSSAVAVDGRAYLFSGPSGVGKSTHTKNWLKLFGDSAYILNDDKPALRIKDGRFLAYGTPWSGKHDISRNVGLPAAGIAFIERAETNSIEAVSPVDALSLLLSQTTRNIRAERMNILLELLDKLVADVPVYRLRCTMDISAAALSYNTMRRKV